MGGVIGYNVGLGSGLGIIVGVVGGGVVGVVVGLLVKDKMLVEVVFLIYKEGMKVYIFIQVGKMC